ncbi:DUF2946 family protein [Pseudacidovorax intermedius]|uniref:DUF2946 family protein n=1 Tax=Pseudacidovorax intermedius TaxID=433924 RepID=A0A147GN51_9BURK|nr:DUF2946 family protein [Pseudacidovorax intermedius]KTT15386.1 hypothetical protein NS331_20975 [Pseudacidovorax intermedius]
MPFFDRHLHRLARGLLGRAVLLWFALSMGAAIASPMVHPQAMELVCSAMGAVKVVVKTDDGVREIGATHMDCPLCVSTGAPPPAAPLLQLPQAQPLGLALQPIEAARLAAATAAPLPARGPPALR